MSGVLGTPAYKHYFGHPSGTRQGGITASMPAGSLFGALSSSFLADRLSRRTAIQIAALVWIVGSIFQTASNGVALLCVGRVVSGWAIGVCSAIVPVYQSEIAPKNIRGRVVSLQQWAITWGILIQYVSEVELQHLQTKSDCSTVHPVWFFIRGWRRQK
jgi:MFS family permease